MAEAIGIGFKLDFPADAADYAERRRSSAKIRSIRSICGEIQLEKITRRLHQVIKPLVIPIALSNGRRLARH